MPAAAPVTLLHASCSSVASSQRLAAAPWGGAGVGAGHVSCCVHWYGVQCGEGACVEVGRKGTGCVHRI